MVLATEALASQVLASQASASQLLIEQPLTVHNPRHVKVTGSVPAFGYEPCEDVGCTVESDGLATSCGRIACPNCGFGGTNLTMVGMVGGSSVRASCTCGYSWVPGEKPVYVVTRAETVECTCPDACERDHSNE
jgi:hypothetical protein